MTEMSDKTLSRRAFVRGAAFSVPVLGAALTIPRAFAEPEPEPTPEPSPEPTPEPNPGPAPAPDNCPDPNQQVDNCVVQLPEEFRTTSFSTSSVASGTNYSVLFSTKIPWGPHIPDGVTGYRISSLTISGTKKDGATFSIQPSIGEAGARGFGSPAGSSLGFVVDHPWTQDQIVREFGYAYNVEYLAGLDVRQTCTYVTAMTFADNDMVVGGIGSVKFSPPRLTSCNG